MASVKSILMGHVRLASILVMIAAFVSHPRATRLMICLYHLYSTNLPKCLVDVVTTFTWLVQDKTPLLIDS